jgi:hypothetical protein
MTTIQVPLDKNPEVAALVADMEPGTRVYGCFSLKHRDAQTVELRIEQMEDDPERLMKPGETDDEEDGEGGEEEESEKTPAEPAPAPEPEESYGKKMARRMNG